MKQYERHYTWSHPLGDAVIAHQDGAVSVLIEWGGLDMELCTEEERQLHWQSLYRCLESLGAGYCAEFHCWREHDPAAVQAYRDKGREMVRGVWPDCAESLCLFGPARAHGARAGLDSL